MSRALRIVLGVTSLIAASCAPESAADPSTTESAAPTTTSSAGTSGTRVGPSTTEGAGSTTTSAAYLDPGELTIEAFPVPEGSRPHDVAPATDGGVWYTAQGSGELGWLDPATSETIHIPLGDGSRPHGVIVDEEGTPWITDGGLDALLSVDPSTEEVTVYPLPGERSDANLNTATFDTEGTLWFTGQSGIYGSLDPITGEIEVYDAPEGAGPYGITATPGGAVFYASLAGSYVGAVDPGGSVTVLEPPNADQGARRVWSDSEGSIWVSEWNSGSLSRYEPGSETWTTWPLPGDQAAVYAVYVDEVDTVWVSDFGSNSFVRFDPESELFDSYPLPHQPGEVRQILGRPGEVWGAESAADHLVLIETR